MMKIAMAAGTFSVALAAAAHAGSTAPAAADAFPIPAYQADYSVARNSLRIGNAHFSLAANGDGSYTYQSITKPAGLAAVFVSDVVTESSHFDLKDGRPHPLLYRYTQTGHEKSETIQFDWDKGTAYTEEDGRPKTNRIDADTADVFLTQLLVSVDAAVKRSDAHYVVLDHREKSSYMLQPLPDAKVKTAETEYDVVVLELKDVGKDRTMDFYLSPALHYLPVQVQLKDPAKTITLVLTDISFGTSVPTAATAKDGQKQ